MIWFLCEQRARHYSYIKLEIIDKLVVLLIFVTIFICIIFVFVVLLLNRKYSLFS